MSRTGSLRLAKIVPEVNERRAAEKKAQEEGAAEAQKDLGDLD